MSKIGRKPINIPEGVEVKINGQDVEIKGSKGTLQRTVSEGVSIESKDNQITVTVKEENPGTRKVWGLERALIANLVTGVSKGFERKLEINGVGYRASVKGKDVHLELGFSHPIDMPIPDGLEVKVTKNIIAITGIDKQLVGQFASNLRQLRPPEPYKGKGIKYIEEHIRRKEGKKAAATEGAGE